MERIQHKLLRFVTRKIQKPISRTCYDYGTVLSSLGLPIVQRPMLISNLSFLSKILNYHLECSDIFSLVQFNGPLRTLSRHSLFHVSPCRANVTVNDCINPYV